MVRITIEPTWAEVLDVETTIPAQSRNSPAERARRAALSRPVNPEHGLPVRLAAWLFVRGDVRGGSGLAGRVCGVPCCPRRSLAAPYTGIRSQAANGPRATLRCKPLTDSPIGFSKP